MGDGRGDLRGKVALVTGAGSGLGEATARAFAGAGCRVACLDVNQAAAERVAADLPGEHLALPCDLLDARHRGVEAPRIGPGAAIGIQHRLIGGELIEAELLPGRLGETGPAEPDRPLRTSWNRQDDAGAVIARHLGTRYLRVDAAETALEQTGFLIGIEGCAVIHELAVPGEGRPRRGILTR